MTCDLYNVHSLYILRRSQFVSVCTAMLKMFYHLVVASEVFYAVGFWGIKIRAVDTKRINKLSRKAESILFAQSDLKK